MTKHHFSIRQLLVVGLMTLCLACQKGEITSLNTPTTGDITKNPSKSDLNNLVSGAESGLRQNIGFYMDDIGIIGREIYHFSSSEPRYTTDLLGGGSKVLDNNTFYLTNPWSARYQVIRQAYLILEGAKNSTSISDAERKGYTGFAKTLIGYQLLLNLTLTDANGIRIPSADPSAIGPVITNVPAAQDSILKYLQDGATDLSGAAVVFSLSHGFSGFADAAGLLKFNKAIAARVDAYRQNWAAVLTDLNGSFFDLNGSFTTGVYHFFSTNGGDQTNPLYLPLNNTGEIRAAHPSFATDIIAGDDRINKTAVRAVIASQAGLSSSRDVNLWSSLSSPVTIIRNEELILLYAEAKIQLAQFPDAIVALNKIRTGHNLPPYPGASTPSALITELLYERRYSLFMEGHRWIDLRRYNLLNTIPIDRPDDDVWSKFPLPQSEVNI
ncbi:RagB/SusD family nutrient uptake outer membrane protein [Chitinophaga sp. Cy-1792]|uniref:RagB/SusD family nutrient uptake outer membrane protein n=1 Tax=Chitinophaga sp. Cy-1792 TaxID=2608339 RepID=UPI001421FC96|nr:RagB/SusD family nutrient uptake outer membrane protein [Chitinophaga sp. Cy-1792]NIG53694.1 RagB/SusD family nutrient uptake outer membrane protein [Chitinophaga sp. Cy-1792]